MLAACVASLCCVWCAEQVAERHNNISRLKAELKASEEREREAQAALAQRGELVQQLKDECGIRDSKVHTHTHTSTTRATIRHHSLPVGVEFAYG